MSEPVTIATGLDAHAGPPPGGTGVPPLACLAGGLVLGCLGLRLEISTAALLWWGFGLPLALASVVVPQLRRSAGVRAAALLAAGAACGLWLTAVQPQPAAPFLTELRGEVASVRPLLSTQVVLLHAVTALPGHAPAPDDRLAVECPVDPPLAVGDRVRVAGLLGPDLRARRGGWRLRATTLTLETTRLDGPRGWAWRALDGLDGRRALAGTLLLGQGQAPETPEFRRSGLLHVLAVSGMHLAIALGAAALLLRGLGLPWMLRQATLVVLAFAYLWLTGASLPTQRAAVMVAALIVCGLGGRAAHPLSALALACIVLLGLDPAHGAEIGFQLTLAAVAGIVTLGRDLLALRRALPWLRPLPLDSLPWRLLLWTTRWTLDGLAIGAAASLAVLPVLAWHFEVVNPWGPIATLLATPPVTVALAAGLLLMLGAGLWPGGPWEGLYAITHQSLDVLARIAEWSAAWPGAMLQGLTINPWALPVWPLIFLPLRDRWDLLLRLPATGLLIALLIAA